MERLHLEANPRKKLVGAYLRKTNWVWYHVPVTVARQKVKVGGL
jgi:hypothetical protein